MAYVDRDRFVAGGRDGGPVVPDPTFSVLYPALWEYLSLERWEDGELRETSTLLLFVVEGRWRACLNDRAHGRSCWRSGDTLEALLVSLEDALASGLAEWRRSRPPVRGRGRKDSG